MARNEDNREDLFADLVTYVPRWEVLLREPGEKIVVAVRPGDRWSLYRGSGDYYQFTPGGQLRRAFAGDDTLLSTGSSLARLRKQRSATGTTLVRRELTPEECHQFLATMRLFLANVAQCVAAGEFTLLRSVPGDADIGAIVLLIAAALQADPPLAPAVGPR